MALVAVTDAVVKVAQNDCAPSRRAVALRALRQLSALQLAATATVCKSNDRRNNDIRDIVSKFRG
jgi:hypothetical protein